MTQAANAKIITVAAVISFILLTLPAEIQTGVVDRYQQRFRFVHFMDFTFQLRENRL